MSTLPPAAIGAPLAEIETPCLLVDLDAFERNVARMERFVREAGVRLRAHAKTHKSGDIALLQIAKGGACGICCQKVGEAEALVGAGVRDVLITTQVVGRRRIERLVALATRARIQACVDDATNVVELSDAASRWGMVLDCLVEIDVGMRRCGVQPGAAAVELARTVAASPGLRFAGLQAYHGRAQHIYDYAERQAVVGAAIRETARTVEMLREAGLPCEVVGGAGTGTYQMEAASGVYTELQCGSYVFMDADYGRVRDSNGAFISEFENSLFVLTEVMSVAGDGIAVCDAGLKASSVDSGMPVIAGRTDVAYEKASDEHGLLSDPGNVLRLGDRLRLIPGHCDPTVNLYDWYVAVRNGRVEVLWPVHARGAVT